VLVIGVLALIGLGGVGLQVWYIQLLRQVRGLIDRHLAGQS
jgi:hypothetical protein